MEITVPNVSSLRFDPLTFFEGVVESCGMVVDFRGRITRRYAARFEGARQDNSLCIEEHLNFSDGVTEQRHWKIHRSTPGHWIAIADGMATAAMIRCDTADPAQSRWTYKMDLPVRGRTCRFAMEDIMTLVEPNRMLALTPMKKFGIKIAYISSEYRRIIP
jgi:Protein of unknown function (DUF3833)